MAQNDLVVPILANNSLFSTMWKLDWLSTDVYGLSSQVSGRVWLWSTKGTCWQALTRPERPRYGFCVALNPNIAAFTARTEMTVNFFPGPTFSLSEMLSSPDVRGDMLGVTGACVVGEWWLQTRQTDSWPSPPGGTDHYLLN